MLTNSFHLFITFLCSIMKARKTMKNQALIQEVISQISQRFAPKIPDIKKVHAFFRLPTISRSQRTSGN